MLSKRCVTILTYGLALCIVSPLLAQQVQTRPGQPSGGRAVQPARQAPAGAQPPRGTIRNAQPLNGRVQGRAPVAGPPQEFQLTTEESARIDKMLKAWEQTSAGIQTFQATFTRWQYDPVFGGPKDNAKRITGGEIRYAAPDRGMIKEDRVADYDAKKAAAGDKWPFTEKKNAVGEHWVCDGSSIFEFSHKTKQLIETALPPEMRGKAIAEGPLPFMFGAKADTIKKRYWVREIPRKKEQDPYHLEFLPKGRGEDYSKIAVHLDDKEFLPTVLKVHELGGLGHSTYQFDERKKNGMSNKMANFMNQFVSPKPPRGWTKIVRDGGGQAQPPRQAQNATQPSRK